MNGLATPLLADVEWVGLLVAVVVIIISVVGKLIAKANELAQPKMPRPMPRPLPPGQPGRPPIGRPQAGPPARKLEDEISDFIRSVADRREQAAPGRPPVVKPPLPVAVQQKMAARAAQSAPAAPPERLTRQRRKVMTVEAPPKLSTLSSSLENADEQADERAHQVFDHELSHIERDPGDLTQLDSPAPQAAPGAGAPLPMTVASGLAAMLAEPNNLRMAVVLNEIMQRPEQRGR